MGMFMVYRIWGLGTSRSRLHRSKSRSKKLGFQEQRLGLVKRLSMMRIIARRTKAATVLA